MNLDNIQRATLRLFVLSLVLAFLVRGLSQAQEPSFTYKEYADVLSKHVNAQGQVDYRALKANRAPLDQFIARLGALSPATYATWDDDAKIAFWSNAYNAITLLYVIDHYPIQPGGFLARARFPRNSIRQIDGMWTDLTTPVLGKPITLDAIENEILRKEFNEPRIHMAIVCASIGCPYLRSEPYTAEKLDAQLTDQAKRFLGSKDKFLIDLAKSTVSISPIFKWFDSDFTAAYTPDSGFTSTSGAQRAVLHFAAKHLSETDAAYLRDETYSLVWLDYDWSLNEQ